MTFLRLAAVALIFFQANGLGRRVGDTFIPNARRKASNDSCDIFVGKWVYDESYPSYDATTICPFLGDDLNCQKNGRPDMAYLKYRWQPSDCELSRFDGRDFLERIRGKKMMFVGDSLSSNMWQSLACLLVAALPNATYRVTHLPGGLHSTFYLPEYEASIMFQKNGFLVRMVKESMGRVLKLDSLLGSEEWEEIDVLIFNSYHWWAHGGKYQTWDYYQTGDVIVKDMDHMDAYRTALQTWAHWVNDKLPDNSALFFQGISSVHVSSSDFNDATTKSCANQTKPREGSVFKGPPYPGEEVIREVLQQLSRPCALLDITLLTHLRPDGHPSTFAHTTPPDCSHWCLPGVPDTWNQLLYASLLHN